MLAEKRQNTAGRGECGKLFRCRNLCYRQSCAYNRLCAPPQHGNASLVDSFISRNQNIKGEYYQILQFFSNYVSQRGAIS